MAFLAPVIGALGATAATAAAVPVVGAAGAAAVPTFLAGAGATGIGAAATTAGLSAASILSGAASVLGAFGSLASGAADSRALTMQAGQADLDAKREQNLGIQRRTAMKRELLTVLGENDVNAAAAGIDLSTGIAEDMNAAAETSLAQELSIDRADQDYRAAQHRARAAGFRSQARARRMASYLSAGGSLLQSSVSSAVRG
ncbi:hypothetical protein [Ancylobacter terrae]|uniref:hypothetical protein n=1 Tax=Ancylobacter sp. sgz301288 TaxID=3342077 RepID=UPI00385C067E